MKSTFTIVAFLAFCSTIFGQVNGNYNWILAQDGATTNQVLSWNGSRWAPSTVAAGGTGDVLQGGNSFGTAMMVGTNDNYPFSLETNGVSRVLITSGSSTGGDVTLAGMVSNFGTIADRLTIQTNTGSEIVAGLGGAILLQGESTTTNDRDMVRLSAYWSTATDISRASKFGISTVVAAGALTEIANFNSVFNAGGALAIGTSNPVTLWNGGLTNSTTFTVGGTASTVILGGSSGLVELSSTASDASAIKFTLGSTGTVCGINVGGSVTHLNTSGTRNVMDFTNGFAPTSGSGIQNYLNFASTINQTGGASGIVRAININNTITAAIDFRCIDIQVNSASAKGVYQSGALTKNYFAGATGIGVAASSTYILNLSGPQFTSGSIVSSGVGTPQGTLASPHLRLINTTASTGDTWYIASKNAGEFEIQSSVHGSTPIVQILSTGAMLINGQYNSVRFPLTDGATIALDWDYSNVQSVTLGGNRTFTFSNPKDGGRYLIVLKQDATGSRTVTWPTIKWVGGTTPTLTTTANKYDLITLIYDGTNYYGSASLNF
ncbi:MAG: hypothetical protein H7246_21845 [Phycisphaerae bacterium]|nr:hypothetical protein [Saprospiraceae bacterium]